MFGRGFITALAAISGALVCAEFVQAQPTPHRNAQPRRLLLRNGDVDLGRRPQPIDVGAISVMQLDGPMTPDRRAVLQATGVRLHGYLPENSYLADLSKANEQAVSSLPFVVSVGPVQKEWKLATTIGRFQPETPDRKQLAAAGKRRLVVAMMPGTDKTSAETCLQQRGARIRDLVFSGGQWQAEVDLAVGEIERLAQAPAVLFVDEAGEAQPRNDTTTWVSQSNAPGSTPLWSAGLHGENQIAGAIDWDMKATHCAFEDTINPIGPLHRKIVAYYGMGMNPGFGLHGTHVAGVLVGDELADTQPALKGMAYESKIVFQHLPAILTNTNLNDRLTIAHGDGVRVHSNSWGNNDTTYNAWARDIDVFTRDHEDDLVLVAVINENVSIKAPENAKNCLAVAATSDTPNQGMRCYGGFGPTADGRQKPEVWTAGCGSVSASNSTTCGTRTDGGTSFATPAVAGMGVLTRQYFVDGFYPTGAAVVENAYTPSGALLKAVLVNSAVDMSGMAGYFTSAEGWGRVLLDDALYFTGDSRRLLIEDIRNANGLSTAETNSHYVVVNSASSPLKITLVWTDAPAALMAAFTPINNLDLAAIEPGPATYLGNVFSGGQSTTGGSADLVNNVEQVHRTAPAAGLWRIDVTGMAVNDGTQGYGLVVAGDVDCLKGDANGDGEVNGLDIQSFVNVILSGGTFFQKCSADINSSGTAGVDDVEGFAEMLVNLL